MCDVIKCELHDSLSRRVGLVCNVITCKLLTGLDS